MLDDALTSLHHTYVDLLLSLPGKLRQAPDPVQRIIRVGSGRPDETADGSYGRRFEKRKLLRLL